MARALVWCRLPAGDGAGALGEAAIETLILVRHAHALSNEGGAVSGRPPGEGLSTHGREEARRAAAEVEALRPALGATSRFARARETLALLLPGVPSIVVPELDEIGFGSFEGGQLDDYRGWAWSAGPAEPCPGGGESRAEAALRLATALDLLLARPERVVAAVSHSLPIRYVVDAASGVAPARRVEPVAHARPHQLPADAVVRAASFLRGWGDVPVFRDDPDGAY